MTVSGVEFEELRIKKGGLFFHVYYFTLFKFGCVGVVATSIPYFIIFKINF